MTAELTDKQLVAKVQKGDSRAFDLLVMKYQHKIMGLISRYVHDADEVQDVAQEAFIKAYRALPRFRGDSAFYTWLYRIAINTAKNHLISRSRRPPGSDVEVEDAEYFEAGGALRDIETPETALFGAELNPDFCIDGFTRPKNSRSNGSYRAIHHLCDVLITKTVELP